jgi:chromosome segregation ATPase
LQSHTELEIVTASVTELQSRLMDAEHENEEERSRSAQILEHLTVEMNAKVHKLEKKLEEAEEENKEQQEEDAKKIEKLTEKQSGLEEEVKKLEHNLEEVKEQREKLHEQLEELEKSSSQASTELLTQLALNAKVESRFAHKCRIALIQAVTKRSRGT